MAELPFGFDRADGQDGRIGTPSAAGQIRVFSGGAEIDIDDFPPEELPDSPIIERAEQATVTHTFRMSWSEALARIVGLGRGTVVQDSFENEYLVLSAQVQREAPGFGLLTVVTEAKSFDSPPDEFDIQPVELGINLLKHPRYFYSFFGDGYGSTTEQQNQMVIRLLQDYFDNTNATYRDAIVKLLDASMSSSAGSGTQPPLYDSDTSSYPVGAKVSGTNMAKAAAKEIVQKWWRGEDTPYIVGVEMRWSRYFFVSPAINLGAVIEDPIDDAVPALPEYFYSRVFPSDTTKTIFDFIASNNPQCYSSDGTAEGSLNISWLRKADQVDFQRTWFKLTSTWCGSPVGHFDEDFYNRNSRPAVIGDYRAIKVS